MLTVQPRGPQPTGPPSGFSDVSIVIALVVLACVVLAAVWMIWPYVRGRVVVARAERWLRKQA